MNRPDRSDWITKKTTLAENDDAADVRKISPPGKRLEIAWEISKNLWAFKGEPVAEPGLHRHIVRLYRRAR